jgi:hypothetical protein
MTLSSNIRTVITCLVLALAPGCATMNNVSKMPPDVDAKAKRLTAPEDQALVYVVRPTMLGYPFGGTVTANGEFIGTTQGGIYIYALLPPGDYKFRVTGHDNDTDVAVKLEAGKVYYIYQSLYTGLFKGVTSLKVVSAEEGREALGQCALGDKLGAHVAR